MTRVPWLPWMYVDDDFDDDVDDVVEDDGGDAGNDGPCVRAT